MKGYILRTGARLAPFGDPIGDTLVLNRRLEDLQRESLAAVCDAVEIIDTLDTVPRGPGDFLLVEDHLFFTPAFLRRALAAARGDAAPVRFALADSVLLREKAVLGALVIEEPAAGSVIARRAPLPLWLWRGRPFDGSLDAAAPLPITPRERGHIPDNLKLLRDDLTLEFAITAEGVMSVRHWSHVLDVNQLALAAFWLDFTPRKILWYVGRALWALATAFSFNLFRIGGRFNVIGRNCQIHPSAWIAGSILGNNVQVGPNAVIFGSVLGDGVKVEGMSDVSLTVAGERAVISFNTRITASVFYPMSMASYPAMQMCLLGRRAFHMGGSYPIDMKLVRGDLLDVKVKHGGKVVDSGKKFLGICVGHGSVLGTGLWVQSGVEIPNDYILVRDKTAIVTKIPDGMEGRTLSLHGDGVLRAYGSTGNAAPPAA